VEGGNILIMQISSDIGGILIEFNVFAKKKLKLFLALAQTLQERETLVKFFSLFLYRNYN